MKHTKTAALLFAPFIILLVFLLFTDPYQLPLVLVLLPFLVLGIGVYFFSKTLLKVAPLSKRKETFIASVVTSTILLLILLQSIRQLSVKDFLILLALLAGLTFYVRRLDL
jgi:hypothetical protein